MKEQIYQEQIKLLLDQVFKLCGEHGIYYFTEFEIEPGASYCSVYYDEDADDFIKILNVYSEARQEERKYKEMTKALMEAAIMNENLN